MVGLGALVVPIVLSAVIVFAASAVVWMVLPHHRKEWQGLANEDAVRAALNAQKPAPGRYVIPFAQGAAAQKAPAMVKKYEEGPVGFLTVIKPGPMRMGGMMAQSFVYYLIVGAAVAYVAGRTLDQGADYLHVFRVTGTTAWLAYGFGAIPDSIWFGKPWSSTGRHILDALLYGLLTAGTFGWLWPR